MCMGHKRPSYLQIMFQNWTRRSQIYESSSPSSANIRSYSGLECHLVGENETVIGLMYVL